MRLLYAAPVLLAGVWADQVFDMLFVALCIGAIRAILLQTKQTPSANLPGPVA